MPEIPNPPRALQDNEFIMDCVGDRVKIWIKVEGKDLAYRETSKQSLAKPLALKRMIAEISAPE